MQRLLSETATIVGGGTPSTKKDEFWNGSINWFTPSEIGESTYVYDSERKISELGLEKSSAKLLPKNKTILFTSRASIGDTAILKREAATNQGFQSLVTNKDTDVYFLYSMSESIKKEALRRATGSTFQEVSRNEMKKIEIQVPEYDEQYKIGKLLKSIDEIITLEQEKNKKLIDFRNQIVRMFYYRNWKYSLKYNNFDNEWREIPLKNILNEINRKTSINDEYPILSSTNNGLYLQKNYFKGQVASENNIGYKILKKNQLVLSPQNLWLGNINFNDKYEIGIVSPSYKVYEINSGYNKKLIGTILNLEEMNQKYESASEQGASIVRRNLNLQDFLNISISLPKLEVQNKVSKLILSIDNSIENQSQLLKKYMTLKINLLHQLFI